MSKYEGLDCILLIDDDDATNFIHNAVIKKTEIDAHVEICNSAEKALDFLASKGEFSEKTDYPRPGIIFLDINMPRMDGWEFLEEYDKLPEKQKAKVVVAMLTTSLNPDDKERGDNEKNVRHFMNKPLTKEMIFEIVKENFGG